jgi:RecA/RadA recombinase
MATPKKLGKAGAKKAPAKASKPKNRAALRAKAQEADEAKGTPPYRRSKPVSFAQTVSTGSTLLDLSISGGRVHGGGIPGGILVEVSGPSGGGKTEILVGVCTSTQRAAKPGEAMFLDPEGRLDEDYAQLRGLSLEKQYQYARPKTVTEMFKAMYNFESKKPGILVTAEMEMGVDTQGNYTYEGEDKYGAKKAKDMSQELRRFNTFIAEENRLLICANQIRDDFKSGGTTTPGGHAVPFYSSLRIEVKPLWKGSAIVRNRKFRTGKEIHKQVGIISNCFIKKSSLDDPFRECSIYILFRYGIDDVRGNLQYLKDMLRLTKYEFRDLSHNSMDMMIQKIEDANEGEGLVDELREEVIALWGEVEERFDTDRKPKVWR